MLPRRLPRPGVTPPRPTCDLLDPTDLPPPYHRRPVGTPPLPTCRHAAPTGLPPPRHHQPAATSQSPTCRHPDAVDLSPPRHLQPATTSPAPTCRRTAVANLQPPPYRGCAATPSRQTCRHPTAADRPATIPLPPTGCDDLDHFCPRWSRASCSLHSLLYGPTTAQSAFNLGASWPCAAPSTDATRHLRAKLHVFFVGHSCVNSVSAAFFDPVTHSCAPECGGEHGRGAVDIPVGPIRTRYRVPCCVCRKMAYAVQVENLLILCLRAVRCSCLCSVACPRLFVFGEESLLFPFFLFLAQSN